MGFDQDEASADVKFWREKAVAETLKGSPIDCMDQAVKILNKRVDDLAAKLTPDPLEDGRAQLLTAIDELSKRICTLRQLRRNDQLEHDEQIAKLEAENRELKVTVKCLQDS